MGPLIYFFKGNQDWWKYYSTVPETNSSPVKIGHPKRNFIFQPLIFRCQLAVSFREGIVWLCSNKRSVHLPKPIGSMYGLFTYSTWKVKNGYIQGEMAWQIFQSHGSYGKWTTGFCRWNSFGKFPSFLQVRESEGALARQGFFKSDGGCGSLPTRWAFRTNRFTWSFKNPMNGRK